MNIKQIITVGVAGMAMGAMALDKVEVTDVKARQRYPWNGLVDIDFRLDSQPTEPYQMQVEVYDNVGKTNLPVKSVYAPGVSMENNPCMVGTNTTRIVWDAGKDLPNGFKCANVLISCRDTRTIDDDRRYMIIDLMASENVVSYTNMPPTGGWPVEYLQTKIVMRKVNAQRFTMGSPVSEPGRQTNEDKHDVILTKPFYVAVYPMTVRQRNVIVGDEGGDTSAFSIALWALRGRDTVVSETRNADNGSVFYSNATPSEYSWPSTSDVDPTSLMGLLREKTGLQIDVPTEAQWECACRAGALTALNIGTEDTAANEATMRGVDSSDESGTVMRYLGNGMPNSLSIYDTYCSAWCLDVYQQNLGTDCETDPIGGDASEYTNQKKFGPTLGILDGNARYITYYANGYCRSVRGGYRSASRSGALYVNLTGEYWSSIRKSARNATDEQYRGPLSWDSTPPTAGVRLAVTINE